MQFIISPFSLISGIYHDKLEKINNYCCWKFCMIPLHILSNFLVQFSLLSIVSVISPPPVPTQQYIPIYTKKPSVPYLNANELHFVILMLPRVPFLYTIHYVQYNSFFLNFQCDFSSHFPTKPTPTLNILLLAYYFSHIKNIPHLIHSMNVRVTTAIEQGCCLTGVHDFRSI